MSVYSDRLRHIADLLDEGEYLEVEKLTFFSPAGDGYGLDNTCINFSDDTTGEPLDIGDVLSRLKAEDKERAIQQHLDAIEQIKRSN